MRQAMNHNRLHWVLTLLMLHLVAFTATAQLESELSYRRYTTQDGLSQMQAEKVWQDSRGYIYIGTLSGLVRYDGRSFTPFLKGRRENIVGFTEVFSSDRSSSQVWALGFRNRWLISFDDAKVSQLDAERHWLLNNFNSGDLPAGMVLMEDEQEEHRWIGMMTASDDSDKGQRPLDDGDVCISKVMNHPWLDKMTPDRRLFIDSTMVYIPTDEGLWRTTIKEAGTTPPRKIGGGGVFSLCRHRSALYAFAEDGIYAVEGDSIRLLTAFDAWEPDYGLIVRTTQAGDILIADAHSLYRYDGTSITQLVGGINLVKDMFIDRWDRLWLATYQGVYCYFGRFFVNARLTDKNDIIRAVAGAGPVMGTLNGKILVNGKIIYNNPANFFLPSAAVTGGRVYLAAHGDVACVSDTTVSWLGLPFDRYQFITEAEGKVILGMRQMVAAYDPVTERTDTLTTTIAHLWCAASDGEGNLWLGSSRGLYRMPLRGRNGGALTPSDTAVQVNYESQKLVITTMEADRRGAVFFASGASLFLIRHGEVRALNDQMPQLSGHEVRSVFVTSHDYLVVAVIDGLFLCRVGQDYQLSEVCFFNHLNGFTQLEPLKARMWEASDGTVYLCGVEEITSFRPDELVTASQADTIIRPPLRWWQHWWVWVLFICLLVAVVWLLTRWYYKRLNHRKLMRLHREKLEREQLIRTIREEAIKSVSSELSEGIVRMTEKTVSPRLSLRTTGGTMVVDTDDIVYLKAEGNYTILVTFQQSEMVLIGLGALSKELVSDNFVRADRSTIVNINHISRLNKMQRVCVFKSNDGTEVETTLLQPAFKRLEEYL